MRKIGFAGHPTQSTGARDGESAEGTGSKAHGEERRADRDFQMNLVVPTGELE